jgi:protein TonB
MFQTLETTWDRSGRRRWSALASFAMQALALSLLLAVPLIWVQGPPRLRWIGSGILTPPPPPAAPARPNTQRPMHPSEVSGERVLLPSAIPDHAATINDLGVASAPPIGDIGVREGTGIAGRGVRGSIGDQIAVIPPPAQKPVRPLRISRMAEGSLAYRLQPTYPPLARAARIQGEVRLRAIISKAGTIENLAVLSGHAMLVAAAVDAVRQWRYHPYMLNGEPVEVETEVTVNFTLGGG